MNSTNFFKFYDEDLVFNSSKDYYAKKLENIKKIVPKTLPAIHITSLKRDYSPSIIKSDSDDSEFKLVIDSNLANKLQNNVATLVFTGVSFTVPDNFVLLLTMDEEPFRMSPVAVDGHMKGAEIGIVLTKCGNVEKPIEDNIMKFNMNAMLIRIDRLKMEKLVKKKTDSSTDKPLVGTQKDVRNNGRCLWKVINAPAASSKNMTLDFLPNYVMVQRQRAPLTYNCFFPPFYFSRDGKMQLNAFIPKIISDGMRVVSEISDELGEFCGVDFHSASYLEYSTLVKKVRKLKLKKNEDEQFLKNAPIQIEELKCKIIQDRKKLTGLEESDDQKIGDDTRNKTTTRIDKSTSTSMDDDYNNHDVNKVEKIIVNDTTKEYKDSSTNTVYCEPNESVKRCAEERDDDDDDESDNYQNNESNKRFKY